MLNRVYKDGVLIDEFITPDAVEPEPEISPFMAEVKAIKARLDILEVKP